MFPKIVAKTLEITVSRILNKDYGDNFLYPTGPAAFGSAYEKITGFKPEEGDYEHVKIGRLIHEDDCDSGIIKFQDLNIFFTKYPGYKLDSKWYCKEEHYNSLWRDRKVFR